MNLNATRGPLALLLTGLLAACGYQGAAPTASHYQQIITVSLKGGESVQGLQKRYGGEVVAFKPAAHFALVATSRPAGLGTLALGDSAEPNAGRIGSAAGAVLWTRAGAVLWTRAGAVLWTRAGAVLWTRAGAVLWTRGMFEPVAENTGTWTSIHLDSAQARLTRLGAGVKVAVIDTGVDLNLSVLQSSLAPQSEWHDYVGGDGLPNEEGTPDDHGYGHGTGIATTVLQVSPGATILPMRVLAQDGSGDVSSTAQAIIDAADKGANIINLSLGMPEESPALEAAISYAEGLGATVVTSSGNDGATTLDSPARGAATDPARLAVGSVNGQGQVSAFSNTGQGLSVYAPGELIYGPAPLEREAAWSGTSQSAAVASGALALGLAEGVQPGAVRSALVSTTAPVHAADGLSVSGAGQLDLDAYARAIKP